MPSKTRSGTVYSTNNTTKNTKNTKDESNITFTAYEIDAIHILSTLKSK